MARAARLKLGLLLAAVLLAHTVGLEWMARAIDVSPVLQTLAPAMYTRTLEPQSSPVVAPAAPPAAPPRTRHAATAAVPRVPASAARPSPPTAPEPVAVADALPPPPPPPALVPPELAPPAPLTASGPTGPGPAGPAAVAAAPAPAASAAGDLLSSWPADTRLSYRLGGQFRSGELFGDARVAWQRDGSTYQVRVDIDITLFATLVLTSQGEVTPEGLMPRVYEEIRPGRKRRSAQFGEQGITLDNGRALPRPAAMQDTASQFVELTHRFATGREKLEVGQAISVWLARPGGLDRWTYDVVEREVLRTPKLGEVEAFRLKPRPIANARGNITAEMWFAPSLQYLPVRIKVIMGDEAFVDLLVERIEQK